MQAVSKKFGRAARVRLFASRHLFALPAIGISVLFLFLPFGHIPRGGALEMVWNATGICVVLLGQGLRVWAAGYMGRSGRSKRLKAVTLLTTGPYAYMRNPLYLGNFLLCLGVMFFTESYLLLLLSGLIFWAFYLPLISIEEEFLQEQFGAEYLAYRQTIPRIVPRFITAKQEPGAFRWSNLRKEYHSITGVISAVTAIKAIEEQVHPLGFLALSGLFLLVPHLLEKARKNRIMSAHPAGE